MDVRTLWFGAELEHAANGFWRDAPLVRPPPPLFLFFYGWICDGLYEGKRPASFGSVDHQKHVWELLPSLTLFHNIDEAYAQNRWYADCIKWRAAKHTLQ